MERHAIQEIVTLGPVPTEGEDASAVTLFREERIQRGDTLASVLTRLGVNDSLAMAQLRMEAPRLGLYQLRTGKTIRAATQLDGTLVKLRYLASDGSEILAQRSPTGVLQIDQRPAQLEVQLNMSSGRIRSSLFQAIDDAGLDDEIAVQLAEIFSGEIDFHRDLQSGDRFSVVYESLHVAGEYVRTGRVVAAEFRNGDRRFRAMLYTDREGKQSYYTEDGKSLRKSFLRSPLEFSRITSGFSSSRFHPVLETWRAHRGVDYGAPQGTRVRATGDAVVKLAGQMRGYGNVVVLRHSNGYETLYGHLSGFGAGVRTGTRVSQGDIIGFVGMTGLASGPHLHYELRVNGIHQDPLKVIAPPAPGITHQQMAAFQEVSIPLANRLDLMAGIDVASSH